MTETEEDNSPKDESNDGDDLNLDAALDALDLDTNFLESGEFQNDDEAAAGETQEAKKEEGEPRTTTPPPPTLPESASHESHTMGTHHWKNRPEIYSRHFKPDPSERAQLEKVAALMGVKSGLKGAPGSKSLVGNLLGGSDNMDTSESDVSHDPQSQWNRLVSGKGTQQTQNLPVSIILYQGTVLYKDYDEATQQPVAHHGCELLLLTRGFLLFQREVKQKSGIGSLFGGGNKTEDILSPLGSSLWTDVRQIQTTNQQSLLLKCGGTNPDDQVSFEIMPTGGDNLVEWRSIIQAAATSAHLNFVTDSRSDSHDERGWQHRLCHTPWFTEAVTGEWEAQEEEGHEMTTSDSAVSGLDALDEYHSYAPLHYATRANHVDIMQRLLEAGANPNIEDGEGKTPMYYGMCRGFIKVLNLAYSCLYVWLRRKFAALVGNTWSTYSHLTLDVFCLFPSYSNYSYCDSTT